MAASVEIGDDFFEMSLVFVAVKRIGILWVFNRFRLLLRRTVLFVLCLGLCYRMSSCC